MYVFTMYVCMFAVVIRCQILSILYLGYTMTLDKDLGSQETDNDQNDKNDCLFNPRTVWSSKSPGGIDAEFSMSSLLVKSELSSSEWLGTALGWEDKSCHEAWPRTCHNWCASLAISSLMDNAAVDGIVWPSEELPRRSCWYLRFILIPSCRFYNEPCNKVCQRIITYLIKS